MDDERLKNPPIGHSTVPDYFDEMLERIRDIRANERRVYLRVKEIFTMAADYEPSNQETNRFFQTIQNIKKQKSPTLRSFARGLKTQRNNKNPIQYSGPAHKITLITPFKSMRSINYGE